MSTEANRTSVFPQPEGAAGAARDNPGVIAPPPLLYLGPLVLGALLNKAHPLSVLPPGPARLLGGALLAGGIALNVWFIATMKRARTPIDPRQPAALLITGGPFRLSRNPSYTAFTLTYAGVACLLNTVWPLLWLPAVLLVMQRGVIAREERYLERAFGEEYRRYRARVRRWL